jgi:hypothetical protein
MRARSAPSAAAPASATATTRSVMGSPAAMRRRSAASSRLFFPARLRARLTWAQARARRERHVWPT